MQMQNLMAFDRLDGTGNIMSGGMSDLTKDAAAVKNFFGTDSINTDIPDEYEIGLDYLSDSEYDKFVKRGLFSWIVEGINAIIKVLITRCELLLNLAGLTMDHCGQSSILSKKPAKLLRQLSRS